MPSKAPPEVLELAKIIGGFIQHWGFKSVHGQIWTLIFLSKEPLNSTLLTKRLSVSKALISLAVKDLLHYEVIEVVEKRNKEIYFRSNPDIFGVIRKVLEKREKVMLEKAEQCVKDLEQKKLPENSNFLIDESRVHEIGQMIEMAQSSLAWFSNSFPKPHE